MGSATALIKYALFVLNTLWAVVGVLAILFAGFGWDAMPKKYAVGIIILGAIILTISLFGCFGAIRESARLIWTYAGFLLALLILIVVFMCFSTRDVFKKYALRGVEDVWNREITHPGAMDTIQSTYACCGRDAADDYVRIGRIPPSSCCKNHNCINPLNLYLIGCAEKVEAAFSDEATTTKTYEWGLLGFNIVILALATILAIHYTNRKRRFNY